MAAEIFLQENSIIVTAAQKMVSLGSEAAQRIIAGKEAKEQDAHAEAILKLLTVYRQKTNLDSSQLESILYDLRELSEGSVFPTINPLVGQGLTYVLQSSSGISTLQVQNNGAALPVRNYLNFYDMLTAVDDGTKINVGLTHGTTGYVLKMGASNPAWAVNDLDGLSDVVITTPSAGQGLSFNGTNWVNGIVGHTIVDASGTSLTARANLKFYGGLTAVDNNPNTDVTWGGALIANTTISGAFTVNFTNTLTRFVSGGLGVRNPANSFDYLFAGSAIVNNRTITLPLLTGNDVLVTEAMAQSLSNKKLGSLTTNGFVKTSGGDGTLSVDTSTYLLATAGWLLASGGTLTGTNTITSNTSNQLLFNGTWTATANNQNHVKFAGTFTSRNTASDTLFGYVFDPILTRNAGNPATQTAYAVYINPTFNNTFSATYSLGVTKPIWLTAGGINWEIGPGVGGLAGGNNDFGFNAIGSTGWGFSQNGTPKVYYSNIGNFQVNSTILSGSLGNYTLWSASFGAVVADAAKLYVRQANLSTGWIPTLRLDPGAHTAITNTLENINQDFRAVTQTWAGGGTVATQRNTYFRSITLAGASAQTFTNAYNVYIDASVAGTNATITNNYALGLGGSAIMTNTNGFSYSFGPSSGTGRWGMQWNGGVGLQIGALAAGTGQGWAIAFVDNNGSEFARLSGATSTGNFTLGTTTQGIATAYIVSTAQTSAWKPTLRIDGGAHTGITAVSEQPNIILNSSTSDASFASGASLSTGTLSKTWLDGTVVTQRDIYVRGITYNKTTTSATFTNAYSVYIDSPTAGTGVSITNNYAIGINGVAKYLTNAKSTASGVVLGDIWVTSTTGWWVGLNGVSVGNQLLNSRIGVSGGSVQNLLITDLGTGTQGGVTVVNGASGGQLYYNSTGSVLTLNTVNLLVGGTSITNTSTILDLQSTTQAFKLTTATAAGVVTPATGMLISDTGSLKYYNGSAWVNITAGGSAALSSLTAASGTNTINNGDFQQVWQWNSLTGANGLAIISSSTAAAAGQQTLFQVALNGANANSGQATTAVLIGNAHTGTTSTNIGMSISASGGTTNWAINVTAGDINFQSTSGVSLIFDTTTGGKIGSGTTQKLAFWGATPIVKPTTAISGAAFVVGAGTAVNDASTFGGYTIKQIAQALINLGLI